MWHYSYKLEVSYHYFFLPIILSEVEAGCCVCTGGGVCVSDVVTNNDVVALKLNFKGSTFLNILNKLTYSYSKWSFATINKLLVFYEFPKVLLDENSIAARRLPKSALRNHWVAEDISLNYLCHSTVSQKCQIFPKKGKTFPKNFKPFPSEICPIMILGLCSRSRAFVDIADGRV